MLTDICPMVRYAPSDDFHGKGLTDEEAARRLKEEGYNVLPTEKKRTILDIIFDIVKEPIFLLLIAAGLVYLVLGSLEDSLLLLTFVLIVVGITIYQVQRVEHALEALKDLSSPRALVIRNGEAKRIPGIEVVRGDIVVLSEGDRVPADGMVLSCTNLLIDESLLTGESSPVRKSPRTREISMGRPGGDDLPYVFSSTLVVQGRGIAEVKEIGVRTEIGKIGKVLQVLKPERTLLQKETDRLVKIFTAVGITVCALVIFVYALILGNLLVGILSGISLAMALIPEEIPVVLTVFLALGAWRLSRRQMLTRNIQSINALGSTTVLCVDKTGTLTMNKMSVKKLFAEGHLLDCEDLGETLPDPFHELVEFAILASQRDPFDPMEKAITEMGKRLLAKTEHLHDDWVLVQEYPLSKKLLVLSRVWQSPGGDEYVVAAKGAPEAIFNVCHIEGKRLDELMGKVQKMAEGGLRVIGVAQAHYMKTDLPSDQHDFQFQFVGLVGLQDPVRPTVAQSVRECNDAGIRVIIITGDYPITAKSVARQAGIMPDSDIITGPELQRMGDEELQERIKTVNIFARVFPEQKLRIINALKNNGHIVAMTGDGVNDAPALKGANVGIAMGGRGTEVAREAASFVVLDDNFSSTVQAVKTGRRIFDNLKKAISFIFAVHVPIAGLALIPILFGWPIILFPAHIAFLELIIDPVCSIVFEAEPEEKDVMKRPPHKMNEPIIKKNMVVLSVLQGFVVLVIVASFFNFALYFGQSEDQARALAFTTLVFADLGLILINRSWSRTILEMFRVPNKALLYVFGGALLFLGLALYVPQLALVFGFGELHLVDLLLCFLGGAISITWFEALKIVNRTLLHNSLGLSGQ